MTSQVEICNLALIALGGEVITAIDDGSRGARLLSNRYELTLNAMLREFDWNFANKRAVLAEDITPPVNGFTKRFALPSDFLKVILLNDCDTIEYRVEAGFICTDEPTVTLEYVAKVTDENLFDAQFVDVFAQRLAAEIAYSLTENTNLTEQAWKIYNDKLRIARTMDSRDGTPRNIEADAWTWARL